MITTELRTATASMTSVPKPLKFLRPHYGALKAYYDTNNVVIPSTGTTMAVTKVEQQQILQFRAKFADVMSVLAMTMGTPDGTFVGTSLISCNQLWLQCCVPVSDAYIQIFCLYKLLLLQNESA